MESLLKILQQVSQVKIKSITDSLFRYGVWIILAGTASAISKADTWVTIFLFSIGSLFLLVGLYYFRFFARKNPDYLRSETFQLKKQSLHMLGDKENLFDLENANQIAKITSPYAEPTDNDENLLLSNEE